MQEIKLKVFTDTTGIKHKIKTIANLIEELGYNIELKYEYGSIVEGWLTATIKMEKC